jgi:hypothetical protein
VKKKKATTPNAQRSTPNVQRGSVVKVPRQRDARGRHYYGLGLVVGLYHAGIYAAVRAELSYSPKRTVHTLKLLTADLKVYTPKLEHSKRNVAELTRRLSIEGVPS